MTRYALVHHRDKGTFESATAAVCYALLNGLNPEWETVNA